MYCIFMGLYGVNLCYIPDWANIHVCICVQCGHNAFNVHNHQHDPCQINRERLDGWQGADHMEKGSWKRGGRWLRDWLLIQVLRISTAVENAAGFSYKFQANCVRLVQRNAEMFTQESREGGWQVKDRQVPVAVVCCSLCEAGKAAKCRRLDPHWQRRPGRWPAGLHLVNGKIKDNNKSTD